MKNRAFSSKLIVFCVLLIIVEVMQGQCRTVAASIPAIIKEQQMLTRSIAPEQQTRATLTPGSTDGPLW